MTYTWTCACTHTGTGEAAAQRHARECPKMGHPLPRCRITMPHPSSGGRIYKCPELAVTDGLLCARHEADRVRLGGDDG